MEPHILIPFLAICLNVYIIAHITVTGSRNRAAKSFLVYTVFVTGWEFLEFVLTTGLFPGIVPWLFKTAIFFAFPLGCLLLKFIFEFIGKKLNAVFYTLSVMSLATIITGISSRLIFTGGIIPTKFGPFPEYGILFQPSILVVFILPVSYGFMLMFREFRMSEDPLYRSQLLLFIAGMLASFFLGMAGDLIVPGFFNIKGFPPMASLTLMAGSFFYYVMLIRYRFLKEGMERIAYNIFSHINDGVLVFDRNHVLTEFNDMAAGLMGKDPRAMRGSKAEEIFPAGYSFEEDYTDREIVTEDADARHLLLSQSPLVMNGIRTGKLAVLRDVTERRRAQAGLFASRRDYQTTLDALDSFIFVVDSYMRIILASRSAVALCAEGGGGEDIIGKEFFSALPFLAKESIRAPMMEALSGGIQTGTEESFTLAGKEICADFRNIPLAENGRIARLVIAIQDITNRKKVEEALRVSEEKFFKAFSASPISMSINRFRDGMYLDVNETQVRMSGYSRDEFLGKSIFDLRIFTDRSEYEKYLEILARDRKVQKFECHVMLKKGDIHHGLLSSEIITIAGVDYVISAIVDISDLKRAQKKIEAQYDEIQEQYSVLEVMNEELSNAQEELMTINSILAMEKERLAATLGAIGEGVITVDRDRRIDMINPIGEKITGWSAKEALGQPADRVLCFNHERIDESCGDLVKRVFDSGNIVEMRSNYTMVNKRGETRHISSIGSPIKDSQGNVDGIVLVFRDVTERKRIEEELYRSSRIESLGIFAGGIAHDFNNLLTSIVGNTSLAVLNTPEDHPNYSILHEVQNASKRASELTYQLLTFARGGAPVKRATSIRDLLTDTVGFVMSGSHVEVSFRIADDLWSAEVDEGQISQVIHNLVLNAAQAIPEKGSIVIDASNIVIRHGDRLPLKRGDYIRVSVTDTGTGMVAEMAEKIFDPFFTTKKDGTGLGLSIAFSII